MSKKEFITYVLLFTGLSVFGQSKQKLISDYFVQLQELNLFNGNALVADNSKIIYAKSAGFADMDKKTIITPKSQFPIASITKSFTATAILQLKQNKKLQLDDAVQKYLPDFPYTEVTIRHLLSNTSGLVQYYYLFDSILIKQPGKVITNTDIVPAYIEYKTPLSFTPGERWEYNNVNFCIAALIIEKVSALSYSTYIQQYIFEPAGMKNSVVPSNRKLMQKNQVERYSYPNLYSLRLENVSNIPVNVSIDERNNFYGNGGIVSTAEDLFRFDQALYNGKLLDQSVLEEAFTPAKLNSGKPATYYLDEKEVAYGLGWEMFTDEKEGKVVFHDGSIAGLTSMLVRNIEKRQTVILLENTGSMALFAASDAVLNMLNRNDYVLPRAGFTRLYGNTLIEKGYDQAELLLTKLLNNPALYNLTEREMNRLGYALLKLDKKTEAITVFKTTTILFPDSWNAYDSYGEALLTNKQHDEAIRMYQKSIELNPDNENGKKVLNEILKK